MTDAPTAKLADPVVQEAIAYLRRVLNYTFDYPERPDQIAVLIKIVAAAETSERLAADVSAKNADEGAALLKRLRPADDWDNGLPEHGDDRR